MADADKLFRALADLADDDKQALFEALAEDLSYELEDGDEYEEDDEPRDPRVDDLYAEYEQRQATAEDDDDEPIGDPRFERMLERMEMRLEDQFRGEFAKLGLPEPNEDAMSALFDAVLAEGPGSHGEPQVTAVMAKTLDVFAEAEEAGNGIRYEDDSLKMRSARSAYRAKHAEERRLAEEAEAAIDDAPAAAAEVAKQSDRLNGEHENPRVTALAHSLARQTEAAKWQAEAEDDDELDPDPGADDGSGFSANVQKISRIVAADDGSHDEVAE